ncbi:MULTISPECIES: AraC family transcriptional regulator [Mesonia]|uniref:HTH-type transcriptional activator RhaS n=1 Tax=Mesonia oceanica TaxID=2687242 RepID=A0AC61Y9I6_9FLAO|nr:MULTISPECIES: AraC family transcriptional regulator [Mesonia]MAN28379.1 AraC family transcriptional regulator [Mesonia sp.]MAQ40565.1 AraC family transcriptional regulator [Mesonia sp.]VVV01053.1 HTH-type transcriptional activator RhaS [Mesonia oceanica]|tara:strand:+ start:7215 stop:8108 length:894 start_codon:yes stop_codon:yes gene_type:complete
MKIPVLKINQFEETESLKDFYINSFSNHISLNKKLIARPHKHNFYLCVMFIKGTGVHEIDFNSYSITPGSVFFLRPGQTHFWKFDSPPEGFIFFHSQEFYELKFLKHKLHEFPFYYSFQNPPLLQLPDKKISSLYKKLEETYTEFTKNKPFKELKIVSLINTVYIDLLRAYTDTISNEESYSPNYLKTLERLEILIDENFQTEKLPKFYAQQLNISTKHLNRVVKETISKTTSELIYERVILEAKRLIVHADENLTAISHSLEFSDYSYFSKIFKLKTGFTPMGFRKKYRNQNEVHQ